MGLIVAGVIILIQSYISLTALWRLLCRLRRLRSVVANIGDDLKYDDSEAVKLACRLAQHGKIRIFGELGASKVLSVIPSAYFKDHSILWIPMFQSMYNYEKSSRPSEQDTDTQYFNLYVKISDIPKIEAYCQEHLARGINSVDLDKA